MLSDAICRDCLHSGDTPPTSVSRALLDPALFDHWKVDSGHFLPTTGERRATRFVPLYSNLYLCFALFCMVQLVVSCCYCIVLYCIVLC